MIEITKPCPFCGTPAKVEDGEHEQNIVVVQDAKVEAIFYCQCIMCGSRGPDAKDKIEAIKDWNNAEWVRWIAREIESRIMGVE